VNLGRPEFSEIAKDLLKGLLTRDPNNRLGVKGVHEIKEHKFFEGLDWKACEARTLQVPYVP
jgi:serum/glucocorticoid-regulated kinase 2